MDVDWASLNSMFEVNPVLYYHDSCESGKSHQIGQSNNLNEEQVWALKQVSTLQAGISNDDNCDMDKPHFYSQGAHFTNLIILAGTAMAGTLR